MRVWAPSDGNGLTKASTLFICQVSAIAERVRGPFVSSASLQSQPNMHVRRPIKDKLRSHLRFGIASLRNGEAPFTNQLRVRECHFAMVSQRAEVHLLRRSSDARRLVNTKLPCLVPSLVQTALLSDLGPSVNQLRRDQAGPSLPETQMLPFDPRAAVSIPTPSTAYSRQGKNFSFASDVSLTRWHMPTQAPPAITQC